MRRVLAPALALFIVFAIAACGDADGPPRMDDDVLATAGGLEFTVDEAADLIRSVAELPAEADVARALAEFWVDYTTLALALNSDDGLEGVDFSGIIRQQENQLLVARLRDEVIDDDVEITDEDVESFYETERPGERVRARHILLLFPEGADQARRDSVEALAEDLRDRARAGEDFAAMAETWSDDEGSATRGGDLNFFARGTMVPPFEEAAFALEPGEVSDVVESQYGLHVIRLEERQFPELDDVRENVREQLRSRRAQEGEEAFIADLEGRSDIEVQDEALERMRAVAENPAAIPSRQDGRQALVTFRGGSFTVNDFRDLLLLQGAQMGAQVLQAPDEALEGFLEDVARSELLVLEARSRGIEPDPEEMAAFREALHDEYRSMARALNIETIERGEGESLEAAVDREIMELMGRIVRGETDVFPMDGLSGPLRSTFRGAVSENAPALVAQRVAEARGTAPGEDAPALDMEPDIENPEDPSDAAPGTDGQ